MTISGSCPLNNYIFIVRSVGLIDINNADVITQTQNTSLYFTELGAKFIVITHSNLPQNKRILSSVFGVNDNSTFICANNLDDMTKTLRKLKQTTPAKLIYLDTYGIYVKQALALGIRGYKIQSYTNTIVDNIIHDLFSGKRY